MEVFLIIALTALIFVLGKLFRLSITSLPMVMALVWSFFVYASLLILQGYPWQYYGLLWILISCIIVLFGFILGERAAGSKWKAIIDRRSVVIYKQRLQKVLAVSIMLGLVYGFAKLQSFGISFSDMFTLEGLGEINNEVAVARYSGVGAYSLLLQLLLSFVYLSPLLGGLLFSLAENKKDRTIALLSFLPEILAFSFSNEKATLIICILLWAASYVVGYMRRYGRYPRMALGQVSKIAALVFGILAVLVISMTLRIGEINTENLDIAMQKFSNSYALSHVPAFDDYFVHAQTPQHSYGVVTFYGVSNFIGLGQREQGVYGDSFSSGDIGTNVFTPFRGLVQDFGVAGGLVFQFVIAFFAGVFAYRVRFSEGNPYPSIVCLIAMYAFVLFTYVSLFSYLSIVAAFALLAVTLAFNPLIIGKFR